MGHRLEEEVLRQGGNPGALHRGLALAVAVEGGPTSAGIQRCLGDGPGHRPVEQLHQPGRVGDSTAAEHAGPDDRVDVVRFLRLTETLEEGGTGPAVALGVPQVQAQQGVLIPYPRPRFLPLDRPGQVGRCLLPQPEPRLVEPAVPVDDPAARSQLADHARSIARV